MNAKEQSYQEKICSVDHKFLTYEQPAAFLSKPV